MISKNLAIGIGILVFVGIGLLFMSNMTGNIITGSVAVESIDVEESFKISDDSGVGEDEVLVDVEVDNGA